MTDESAEHAEATPKAHRRRRASVGGQALKLEAPAREGYVRRWVNDDPARIAEMHDLGYDFAEQKAGPGRKRTDGLGTRISRHGGKSKEGKAQLLYLMETPDEEYAVGKREKEARVAAIDTAIREGVDPTGQLKGPDVYSTGNAITHQR